MYMTILEGNASSCSGPEFIPLFSFFCVLALARDEWFKTMRIMGDWDVFVAWHVSVSGSIHTFVSPVRLKLKSRFFHVWFLQQLHIIILAIGHHIKHEVLSTTIDKCNFFLYSSDSKYCDSTSSTSTSIVTLVIVIVIDQKIY